MCFAGEDPKGKASAWQKENQVNHTRTSSQLLSASVYQMAPTRCSWAATRIPVMGVRGGGGDWEECMQAGRLWCVDNKSDCIERKKEPRIEVGYVRKGKI